MTSRDRCSPLPVSPWVQPPSGPCRTTPRDAASSTGLSSASDAAMCCGVYQLLIGHVQGLRSMQLVNLQNERRMSASSAPLPQSCWIFESLIYFYTY